MHTTTVKMKDGRILAAPIWLFRPEQGFMCLMGIEEKLQFKDMLSALTEGERIGYGKIGTQNEIERAKKHLQDARKFGWYKDNPLPIQDWESEDHQTGLQ